MKRGEIWLLNLDPTVGSEIKKTRPVIIINDDSLGVLPLKIIVPLTDWKDRYREAPWMVRIDPTKENGLRKSSAIDTFQIRSVSQERFVRRVGKANEAILERISVAVSLILNMS
jgi:mRNA interferase MazF